MCCGSVRGLWAICYLPWSFLSVREAEVFTCLFPCLLECQVHTNSHAKPENLTFLKHHCFLENIASIWWWAVLSWGGQTIVSPGGEVRKKLKPLLCQYCNQESKFLFFRGQVIYSNGCGSSLSSLAAFAVSPASVTHRALLINPMKLSVPCWSRISVSSQRSRCCMKAQACPSGCTMLSLVLVFLLEST